MLRLHHFTDPSCPFAFSAEPVRRKLDWAYGDALEWQDHMIVLSTSPEDYEARGFGPEQQATSLQRLAREHGMPIDASMRPRMAATEPACRAVVAARRRDPALGRALLRRLRDETMSARGLLDEPATVAAAARSAGLDPDELAAWAAEPATDDALAEDVALSRHPTAGALALDHKLAPAEHEGRRYTAPSYVFERIDSGQTLSAPGFQPWAVYEVAVANLAPELTPRAPAQDPLEVLNWAGEPLAAVEVAAVRGISREDAREELARIAAETAVGAEGWWRSRERVREAGPADVVATASSN